MIPTLAACLCLGAVDLGELQSVGVRARLLVTVHREGAGPGLARARYDLEIDAPGKAEVRGPRLEDSLSAWRTVAEGSSWSEGRQGRWLELEQDASRPGAAPLPGVVLRVRASPEGPWSELSWPGPLHTLADIAGPERTPPPPPGPWWPWALGLAAAAGAAAYVLRPRRLPPPPPTPREKALARLASARTLDEAEAAVRTYFHEQHGIPLSRLPDEVGPAHPRLAEVLRRCQACRFSPRPAPPAELEDTLALARLAVTEDGEEGQTAKEA
jgi:hypothetical protein